MKHLAVIVVLIAVAAACTDDPAVESTLRASTVPDDDETITATEDDATGVDGEPDAAGEGGLEGSAEPASANATEPRPDWLGTRTLPTIPDGRVITPQTTPEELLDRRFATIDLLDPPPGDEFVSTVQPIPDEVLARSTWEEGCPVAVEELSYLTMSFWGFDGQTHTGEMIVNRSVAGDVVSAFSSIFEARFPIEQMTIVSPAELDADPTGDGNNTTAFVCRPVTGGTSFSQHAFGLAVDINPFHNPYIRNDLVLPELAGTYLDRDALRDGMVSSEGPVVAAFKGIGWSWGGDWRSLKDYQHFSSNNR